MSLISLLKKQAGATAPEEVTLAIVKAANEEVMESVTEAVHDGQVKVVLIDDQAKLEKLLTQFPLPEGTVTLVDEADDSAAAQAAVQFVREGKATAIMKGKIETGKLLKAVVNKETGIRKSALLSHVAVLYVPGLDRLIALTDGGMVLEPNKEELKIIMDHAVEVMHAIGFAQPKVSFLSAAESVIPKLQSSVDAQAITQEATDTDRIVEGPLSIDISLSKAIAQDKKWPGKIKGDADILVVPNIVTGNSVSKSMILFGGAKMAGLILGAQVPIILTSRSASAEEKYASIILSQLVTNYLKEQRHDL